MSSQVKLPGNNMPKRKNLKEGSQANVLQGGVPQGSDNMRQVPCPQVFCPVISLYGELCLVLWWTAYCGHAISPEKQEVNL